MKKSASKLVEEVYLNDKKLHESKLLTEMAEVTRQGDPFFVTVYPREHNPPHFHLQPLDRSWEVMVSIDDPNVITDSHPRKGVPRSKLKSWYGIEKYRKLLFKWLKEENHNPYFEGDNHQAIKAYWFTYHSH